MERSVFWFNVLVSLSVNESYLEDKFSRSFSRSYFILSFFSPLSNWLFNIEWFQKSPEMLGRSNVLRKDVSGYSWNVSFGLANIIILNTSSYMKTVLPYIWLFDVISEVNCLLLRSQMWFGNNAPIFEMAPFFSALWNWEFVRKRTLLRFAILSLFEP